MNKSILVLTAVLVIGLSLAPVPAVAAGGSQANSTKGTASNVRPRTTSKYSNKPVSRRAVDLKPGKARDNSTKNKGRKERGDTAASVIRRNREASQATSSRDTRRDGRRMSRPVSKTSKSRHVRFRTNGGQRGS